MKSEKTSVKKVLSVIGNVICWLFVIFAAVITILTFAAQSSEDGVPSIAGRAILTVETESMSPTFNAGDVIIGQKLLPQEQAALQVDDIITYDAGDLDGDGRRNLNTHRIVEVINEEGAVSYRTKGDHNSTADKDPVGAQSVICKYNGTRIQYLGSVLHFLQQPTGFLIVIVIPLILLFLFELIRFIRKYFQLKSDEQQELSDEEKELIRQKAIEEYLREQELNRDVTPAEEAETPAEQSSEEQIDGEN